jgi:Transposase, Mutator family
VHLIRNSLAFISWKDRKLILPWIKAIYRAETADIALVRFEEFEAGASATPQSGKPGAVHGNTSSSGGSVRSQWRWFVEQIELQVVRFGLERFAVTADLGQVGRLEFQGKLHQRVGDVRCGFVRHGVVR